MPSRSYECMVCGNAKYTKLSQLQQHMRNYHTNTIYHIKGHPKSNAYIDDYKVYQSNMQDPYLHGVKCTKCNQCYWPTDQHICNKKN